jgi:superfamily I DNA and/or RNA helicase
LIIASIGLSDRDQLRKENEFIYNLNRFNVLTSRAKNKVILVCSEEFLEFHPYRQRNHGGCSTHKKICYELL